MLAFLKDVPLFNVSEATKPLGNILCSQYKVDTSTAKDLLCTSDVGNERISLEYILPQPTGGPKKKEGNVLES